MGKMNLIDLFKQNQKIKEWTEHLSAPTRQLVMGFSSSSKALAIAAAYKQQKGKIVIVTSTQNEAEKLATDLISLIGEEEVYQFFADDVAAAEFIFASQDRTNSQIGRAHV